MRIQSLSLIVRNIAIFFLCGSVNELLILVASFSIGKMLFYIWKCVLISLCLVQCKNAKKYIKKIVRRSICIQTLFFASLYTPTIEISKSGLTTFFVLLKCTFVTDFITIDASIPEKLCTFHLWIWVDTEKATLTSGSLLFNQFKF